MNTSTLSIGANRIMGLMLPLADIFIQIEIKFRLHKAFFWLSALQGRILFLSVELDLYFHALLFQNRSLMINPHLKS